MAEKQKKGYVVLAGVHHDEAGKAYTAGQVVMSEHNLAAEFREKFRPLTMDPVPQPDAQLPPTAVSQAPLTTGEQPWLPSRPTLENNPVAANSGPPANDAATVAAQHAKGEEGAQDSDDVAAGPQGKDVTGDFAKAKENDYTVRTRSRKFYVYDNDNPGTPLNAEGVNKSEVDGLVEKDLKKGK